ncbi:hypothetical protein Tco_0515216, partial [Tanacetum coccineum]
MGNGCLITCDLETFPAKTLLLLKGLVWGGFKVWIKQKSKENHQKRANTDTGNGRAQKKPGNQAKVKKECRVDVKKAQEEVGICKEVTQRTSTNVTSMDCQLGNP